jgi:hypothetical protein
VQVISGPVEQSCVGTGVRGPAQDQAGLGTPVTLVPLEMSLNFEHQPRASPVLCPLISSHGFSSGDLCPSNPSPQGQRSLL